MASPVKTYQKEMHRNVGFFANWFPGDVIDLGDAGVFQDGRFIAATSLAKLGIPYDADRPGRPQTLQYSSASGTSVRTSASADAAELATAEIAVEFSNEGAFLFHASGVTQARIDDRMAVMRGILAAYERGDWQKDWWMIESLYRADCATVMVSQDKSSALVINASSDTPLGSLPLADPKVELSVESTRGKLFHLVAGRCITPLYSCLRVKDPIVGAPRVEPVRGAAAKEEALFDRPSIDDLLES